MQEIDPADRTDLPCAKESCGRHWAYVMLNDPDIMVPLFK